MDNYRPTKELCPTCRATLLADGAGETQLWCPHCETWRTESVRARSQG
jgi:tRNA(Ile2) C34 agmatinyltransferase TiaS